MCTKEGNKIDVHFVRISGFLVCYVTLMYLPRGWMGIHLFHTLTQFLP